MSALGLQPQAHTWEEVSTRLHTIQALQATISAVKAMARPRVTTVRLRVITVHPLQETVMVVMVTVLHKATIVQALPHTTATVRPKETIARTLHAIVMVIGAMLKTMMIDRNTVIPNTAISSRIDRIHLMVTSPSDPHRIKEATISPVTLNLATPLKITNKATLSNTILKSITDKAILRSIISRAIPKNIISKAIHRRINLSKVTVSKAMVSKTIVAMNTLSTTISNGTSYFR
jgi:hypothetical protein